MAQHAAKIIAASPLVGEEGERRLGARLEAGEQAVAKGRTASARTVIDRLRKKVAGER